MFDLAILGSGFSGTLLAQIARRLGLTVLLLERGQHPRFAIGESTSPLTNLLLEELALRFDLPRLLPLTQYGAWKRAYPELTVGLKRGFTFYQQRAGHRFQPQPERENELLVAASPNDEVADTHWYRAEFDYFLLREAQELGAEYVDRTQLSRVSWLPNGVLLEGARGGVSVSYRAKFLVDATGPRGALSRLLDLGEQPLLTDSPTYPGTQALFSHFTGAPRFADLLGRGDEGSPYPPDDAALHHVFDGGWVWVLRFENGITSAGFAVTDELAAELGAAEGEPAWQRFLDRFPSIRDHFEGSEAVLPFVHMPRLSYRCREMIGERFALLPSAAGFVDPLFSTGFPLTLLGVRRLAEALANPGKAGIPSQEELERYREACGAELTAAARLVGASYASFREFKPFAALSMLYFAAASYAEMARRLDRPQLANRFLLGNRPEFAALFERHCRAAAIGSPSTAEAIAADLQPYNIAGLCDPAKRNWYGVDLQDVFRGAAKLEVTPEEVEACFRRMGVLEG